MLLPKGLVGIVIGLALAAALMWMYKGSEDSLAEAHNIRENGWCYYGTSVLTNEQFNAIKHYDGFHQGTIKVIAVDPLTVQYDFGSLEDISYLTKQPWGWTEKTKDGVGSSIIVVLFAFPILYIINGFFTLGE